MSIDPPPNLAIEIDVTSFTRIEDYIALAISEVWIYKTNKLHIYLFVNNKYVEADVSLIFSDFPIKEILTQYVSRAW